LSETARGHLDKPLSTQSLAHLYELISREPPLTRNEVLVYERNLPAIVALDADPSGLRPILEQTGLSQTRLTYVVTKIGAGLAFILDPGNPRLKNIPEFVKPTPRETELIVERLEKLVDGFQDLRVKPGAAGTRGGKKPGARGGVTRDRQNRPEETNLYFCGIEDERGKFPGKRSKKTEARRRLDKTTSGGRQRAGAAAAAKRRPRRRRQRHWDQPNRPPVEKEAGPTVKSTPFFLPAARSFGGRGRREVRLV
jgi:hypothetical protein